MRIVSHTLAKNGQPFIFKVIEQVIPYMDTCVVTLSKRSSDGTKVAVEELKKKYPGKIDLEYEKVKRVGELTLERQKMIYRQPADWVLFLDDDDYWPRESISGMIDLIKTHGDEVPAFACNPYQVIDKEHHDGAWSLKWFSKWFKNENINYRGDWPRDNIFNGNSPLYWRQNTDVKRVPFRYYHLSDVKGYSFRDEGWAEEYKSDSTYSPKAIKFNEEEQKIVNDIFSQ